MSWNKGQRRARRRPPGFSLLEVLVAFAILAVSLGAVYQAFGIGARNARTAEAYTVAVLLAESQLATVGIETPLLPGGAEGTFGRYRWQQSVSLATAESALSPSAGANTVQLYEVTVTVTWGDDGGATPRTVTLRTMRLGELES